MFACFESSVDTEYCKLKVRGLRQSLATLFSYGQSTSGLARQATVLSMGLYIDGTPK